MLELSFLIINCILQQYCILKIHRTYQPVLRVIALSMAIIVLFVQFSESFHHHQHVNGVEKEKRRLSAAKAGTGVECPICHYIAHQQMPVLAILPVFNFLPAIILLPNLINSISASRTGYHCFAGNKGPPAKLS